MFVALEIAERGYILENGQVVAEGDAKKFRCLREVRMPISASYRKSINGRIIDIKQAIVYGIGVGVLYGLAAVGLPLLGVARYMNIARPIHRLGVIWSFGFSSSGTSIICFVLVMAAMFLLGLIMLFSPLEGFRKSNDSVIPCSLFGLVLALTIACPCSPLPT
jgi:hypothetical protein